MDILRTKTVPNRKAAVAVKHRLLQTYSQFHWTVDVTEYEGYFTITSCTPAGKIGQVKIVW